MPARARATKNSPIAARGLAPSDWRGPIACPANHRNEILIQRRFDSHLRNLGLGGGQQRRIYRFERRLLDQMRIRKLFKTLQNFSFRFRAWIIDPNFHQETVELRFRQGIGSLELHWILRCEHCEVRPERS